MGAGSHLSFDNDDAMDFIADLVEEEGLDLLVEAIETVLEAEDDSELPEASNCIAAAEVVAAINGKPSADLPDSVKDWITGKGPISAKVVARAKKAVTRVLKGSELKDLWEDSDDYVKWKKEVDGLLKRLA